MPELPEVETIVRELRRAITGEKILNLKIEWPRTVVNENGQVVAGQVVHKVNRHGKFIIFEMNSLFILTHLRMTGQYIFSNTERNDLRHLRVLFEFESGNRLYFYDARKFGRIYLTQYPDQVLKNYGIDALDKKFSAGKLKEMLATRNTSVKQFLIDQRYVSGLGNIYCDEALFRAGIHPAQPGKMLSAEKIERLYSAICTTLEQAIQNMGTTISNYKTSGGGFGSNQHFLNVYGRNGEACYRCNSIIQKIRTAGRGTHFCPQCQPFEKAI